MRKSWKSESVSYLKLYHQLPAQRLQWLSPLTYYFLFSISSSMIFFLYTSPIYQRTAAAITFFALMKQTIQNNLHSMGLSVDWHIKNSVKFTENRTNSSLMVLVVNQHKYAFNVLRPQQRVLLWLLVRSTKMVYSVEQWVFIVLEFHRLEYSSV